MWSKGSQKAILVGGFNLKPFTKKKTLEWSFEKGVGLKKQVSLHHPISESRFVNISCIAAEDVLQIQPSQCEESNAQLGFLHEKLWQHKGTCGQELIKQGVCRAKKPTEKGRFHKFFEKRFLGKSPSASVSTMKRLFEGLKSSEPKISMREVFEKT